MKNVTRSEKQMILYAKCYFGKIDYEKDLQYFIANDLQITADKVHKEDIVQFVITLYDKLVADGYITFSVKNFIERTFQRKWVYENQIEVRKEDIMKNMLSEIQAMKINGLDLPEPDFTILVHKYTIYGIELYDSTGNLRSRNEIQAEIRDIEESLDAL
ncbi:hypothetical protein [Alkalihalobacillus sp. LMS39]|uniref:hypothetical protein n=1 Tax=Alkalihalobacillus sp. LMS39 TaxID=2924032 RepID=UPI001FB225AA|nr:hypothetical protein [Alkalihalobacillus sp. LMS39]UOE96196.1 hypothetical protein MM271_11590 [Alkalihalobacillus sp. LMS39]